MLIMSPSFSTVPLTVAVRASPFTSSSAKPQTQVRPMPRATTAAWLVLPPREVSTPLAAIMPPRSSGLVSLRTRMTGCPACACVSAVLESNTMCPVAAPGDAAMPLPSWFLSASASNRGNISCASWAPFTRSSASSIVIRFSSTSCVAMRKAAAAVRFPTRVCSIQSLLRSIVNSMSHRSR